MRGDEQQSQEAFSAALVTAIDESRILTARTLCREAVESGDHEAALSALAALAGHDPRAVELFIETLDASGTVRRFARAALLDATAVEDVSQDALISIAASLNSFDGRSKVTTWVHSIVRRRVADHLRHARDAAPLPGDDQAPAERMSSLIATRTTVQQALERLDPLYRQPVVLRDIEGLPYATIADRLDRPIGTVKAQISRGRAMVAALLQDTPEEPEPA